MTFSQISAALPSSAVTSIEGLPYPHLASGKVREIFDLGDALLLVEHGPLRLERVRAAQEARLRDVQGAAVQPIYPSVPGAAGRDPALYDLLVGSTTHGVLMRAKCPVVIVPASKGESPPKAKRERMAVT